jgi:hypothetical protein
MIIRNYAYSSARLFKTADNRSQTTDHGPPLIVVVVRFDSLITIGCRLWTVNFDKKMVHC